MKFRTIIICAIALYAPLSCIPDNEVGKDDKPVLYKMGNKEVFETGIVGLSAVCVNENGDGLYGALDDGLLYEIGLDGTVKGTVPFKSEHDWEGVTVDRGTGTVYLSEEREWAVYKVNADKKGFTKVCAITVEGGTDNRGFEGVAFGNGMLYLANQASPRRIYTWSLAEEKVVGTLDLDVSVANFLSDIFYDERNGSLWITDSKKQQLTNMKTDGTVIGVYDISFVQKPEGFCIDIANKTFWFCCDTTGKLYKVSYEEDGGH